MNSPTRIKKAKTLEVLQENVDKILKSHKVENLLKITYKKTESEKEYERTEKRKGKARKGSYSVKYTHYEVCDIKRNDKAIADIKHSCGSTF